MRPIVLVFTLLLLSIGGACGGGGDGGGGGITLSGAVVNGRGLPVPLMPVVVEGHAPVVTDADGRFSVPGVSVPYTLILVIEPGQLARVIVGLTRTDPTVSIDVGLHSRSASVSGSTTGGAGFPLPPNHVVNGAYRTAATDIGGSLIVDATTGNWTIPSLEWEGPVSTTARFFALQYQVNAFGLAFDFTGMGTLDVAVTNGDSLAGLGLTLGAVGTATVEGTINTPAGYTVVEKSLQVRHASGNGVHLPGNTSSGSTFFLATADAPDLSTDLLVRLTPPGGGAVLLARGNVAVPAAGLTLDVPPQTVLVSPPNGAVSVWHETEFQVSPGADRLYVFSWIPQGVGPAIGVITADPSARIPDLSAYGLTLLPGTAYQWACQCFGYGLTVDEFAASGPVGLLDADEGFLQFTDPWTFTTAP